MTADLDTLQSLRDAEIRLSNAESEHAKAKALLGACKDELKDAQDAFRQAVRATGEALPLFDRDGV